MDNVNENPVGLTQEASSEIESNQTAEQDVVKYESYKKVLGEAKNAKERARQLEAELEAKKNAELEAQGNYQEIIDNLKAKTLDLESKYRKERENTLWKDVTGAIKNEATRAGCINPDKLIRLLDKSDFETLQADDGQIRQESVQQLIERAKKEDYYLFTKGNVPMMDAIPSNKIEKQNFNDLSKDEIIAMLKA
jgi:hypothetical protein